MAGGGLYAWRQAHNGEAQWAVVQHYCFDCHNRDDLAGDRAFDALSPDHIAADAETWELAIRKLRAGLMPPAGGPHPDGATVDRLASWLEDEIDAAADEPAPGRVSLRRLNRHEYANAIRDLVGLEVDSALLLPEDNVEGYFDNNADALQVSPAFISQYVDAARAIAVEAVGDPQACRSPRPTATRPTWSSLPPDAARAMGAATSPPGHAVRHARRFVVKHDFPADGEYELTIGDMALAREVPRMEFENTVVVLLDGKEFYRTNIGGEVDHKSIDTRLDPAVEEINNRLRKIHFQATAGQHDLAVTFVHRSYAESDERTRTVALEGGQERIQAAHALQVRGPLTVTGLGASPSRDKIFICRPSDTPNERTQPSTSSRTWPRRVPPPSDRRGSGGRRYDAGSSWGLRGRRPDARSPSPDRTSCIARRPETAR